MKETVSIPSELQGIIPDYLTGVISKLKEIERISVQAAESGLNPELLQTGRRLAHNLKGNGAAYGFEKISQAGEEAENLFIRLTEAGPESDLTETVTDIQRITGELALYINNITINYV